MHFFLSAGSFLNIACYLCVTFLSVAQRKVSVFQDNGRRSGSTLCGKRSEK